MNLKRVLLADGLTPVRIAATALLRDLFEIVGTVSDGQAALDAILELEPDLAVHRNLLVRQERIGSSQRAEESLQ